MALKRLDYTDDYKVTDDSTDIRGWKLVDSTSGEVGTIDGLLFDPADNMVRYAIADLGTRCVLVPVGDIDIQESGRRVVARSYTRDRLMGLRTYTDSEWSDTSEREHYNEHITPIAGTQTDRLDYSHDLYRKDVPKRIQLLEEKLRVGKTEVQTGEFTAGKRVVTENVSENVTLKRDEIDIERHAVNRPARAGETIGMGSDTVSVPLYAEKAQVEKQPFVKEEITIDKVPETRTETVSEQVRREELVTEQPQIRERELTFSGTEPTEADRLEREQIERRRIAGQEIDIVPDSDLPPGSNRF